MIDNSADLIIFTPIMAAAIPLAVQALKSIRMPTDAAGIAAVLIGILAAIALSPQTDGVVIATGMTWGLAAAGVYSQIDHFNGKWGAEPLPVPIGEPPPVIELDTMPLDEPQPIRPPRKNLIGDDGSGFSLN